MHQTIIIENIPTALSGVNGTAKHHQRSKSLSQITEKKASVDRR
jgi:hypothetical protein